LELLGVEQPAALLMKLLDRDAHDPVAPHRAVVVQAVPDPQPNLSRNALTVLVTGATVTVDILPTMSSRVSTNTGRRLSSVAMCNGRILTP